MAKNTGPKRSLYERRLQKESAITEDEIQNRMNWGLPVLSENAKCSIALDLPITNCIPTEACAEVCYASQGRQFYRKSIIKTLAVSRMIDMEAWHVALKMVDEAAGRTIRIAGSGEILPKHKSLLDYVEAFGGQWWGFTRRVDTHRVLPKLMFSIDATTPASVLQYVEDEVPAHRRAYLVRPDDPPPSLEVAVTFPTHGHLTNYVDMIPRHELDCPADRHEVAGCWKCKRCY